MKRASVILNFSGVYHEEGMTVPCGPWKEASAIDLKDIDGTNCYCDPDAYKELESRLAGYPVDALHWIDSGDYHYLSLLWASRINEDFSLVLFDHHPDMQIPLFPGMLSCGGWVRVLLENSPSLNHVFIIGSDPELNDEVSGFEERVHLMDRPSFERGGVSSAKEFVSSIQSPDMPIYLSIDKDVLSEDYARTNWSHGIMTLPQLLELVAWLKDSFSLIGADICGERPSSKGGDGEDFALNYAANAAIAKAFGL